MSNPLYDEIRAFIGFGPEDHANLKALAPVIEKRGAGVTSYFYAILGGNPTTAALIEGRVDRLKPTHSRWMGGLVAGDYGDTWFDAQVRIGQVHVAMGISPLHVELTFGILRDKLGEAVHEEIADAASAAAYSRSMVKALDISLALVNHAYAEERLHRLSNFTGFSRKLIENCINKTAK